MLDWQWLTSGVLTAAAGSSTKGTGMKAAEPANQRVVVSAGQAPEQASPKEDAEYDAYEPLVMAQAAGRAMLHYETFDAALDEFYSKVGGQRAPCCMLCTKTSTSTCAVSACCFWPAWVCRSPCRWYHNANLLFEHACLAPGMPRQSFTRALAHRAALPLPFAVCCQPIRQLLWAGRLTRAYAVRA